jgi:ubiquinone/menaquinone biosynthesis C-methylase UbiE
VISFFQPAMLLKEAIALLQHPDFKRKGKQVWADLGCGDGLFTYALASLLSPQSMIYAIDNNAAALQKISSTPDVSIQTLKLDFVNESLNISNLDGIFMANSLHYVKDKIAFLAKASGYMKQVSSFFIVEYDLDIPVSTWVPYPISFQSLEKLFIKAGYTSITKLHERPSVYGRGNIYSAIITK